MRSNWMVFALCVATALLCGCSKEPAHNEATTADNAVAAPMTPQTAATPEAATPASEPANAPTGEPASGLQDKQGNPIALLPFDIDSVPLSNATLGGLPFFSLPTGYKTNGKPDVRAFARFPFMLGKGLHWVQGASWNTRIYPDDDKTFSPLELRRNLEAVLTQAGAKKVFDGESNRELYYGPQLEAEIGGGFIDVVNMDDGTPTEVYVIRQANRNIWVQLSIDSGTAGLVVVEEKPFVATAHWSDEFPYLVPPENYTEGNRPEQYDFDMYPFWTGSGFEEVEGKTYERAVQSPAHTYSMYEVRRNLESMMAEAGGVKVFDGHIPKEASDRYDSDLKSRYSDASGYSWNEDSSLVYRIDRPDGRQVWVHASLGYLSAGWVVAERKGLAQTAALLPASELKKQLDAAGKVALQVHFATDETDILPESQPQLAQVVQLLYDDPALKLAINGHTDNTGTSTHNQALSEGRAEAVVAALVAQGIDASRLSAAGFGDTRPVADNATEEGKAQNRRVELVKRS